MATSGILPPNSDRGKSFVHDSKLVNNGDVRAHIKLTLETYTKDVVSAVRKYTISRDKMVPNKFTFKTGETVLNVKPAVGEESTVSMKCAEMDLTVPSLMGLSRALIDSVIFCHQDENNWALDDLSAVKARFDDLLETSRYTKAIGALGKARKEQEDSLKIAQAQLESVKQQIIQMAELKNQLNANVDELTAAKEKAANLEAELDALKKRLKEYETKLEGVSKVSAEVKEVTACIEKLTDEENELMMSMEYVYDEKLQEMEEYRAAVASRLEAKEEVFNDVTQQIDKMMDIVEELHQQLSLNAHKANSRTVLKETIKTLSETTEAFKKEIMKRMGIDESEFDKKVMGEDEDAIFSMEESSQTSVDLDQTKVEMNELETTLLDLNTDRSGKEYLLQTLLSEIYSISAQIDAMGDLDKAFSDIESQKEEQLKLLKEENDRLEERQREQKELRIQLKKIRNSIKDIWIGNNEEINMVIKFLQSIIDNDKESILSYLREVMKEDISEAEYDANFKGFIENWFLEQKGKKKKSGTLLKSKQFQDDCVTAIMQMIEHCGEPLPTGDNDLMKEEAGKPYNIMLKVATNTRISDYIEYYKSVTNRGSVDERTDEAYSDVLRRAEDIKDDINRMEEVIKEHDLKLGQLKEESAEVLSKVNKINEMRLKLSDMEARRDQYIEDMKCIQEAIDGVKEKIKMKRDKYNDLTSEMASANVSHALNVANISSLIERYKENVSKIKTMESDLLLTNEEDDVDVIKERINEATELMKNNRTEQKELMEAIGQHRELLQSIEQNIKLKVKQEELAEAKQLLFHLMDSMGGCNESQLIELVKETSQTCSDKGMEIATLKGVLMTREENITKLKSMLESDNYKYVQQNYVDILVKLKSHTLARDDLELYIKALEMALHNFHSEKIAQINTILKRVWREVYTGNQIDYIEIKSNVENGLSISQAPRSYNYRMVMVTHNGAEMDMRGHSSAGERVLASLILRITLTETFCFNCNILTLDEPTTNLDRENTRSLEASLVKLVNECSMDFQLVIITHDEPFARQMAQKCRCDMYYKITKNAYNESVINAVPLSLGFMP